MVREKWYHGVGYNSGGNGTDAGRNRGAVIFGRWLKNFTSNFYLQNRGCMDTINPWEKFVGLR